MIRKILVLILVFALVATAAYAQNKNDNKDNNWNDGNAGKGNDYRDDHHDGDGSDDGSGEDDSDDGSEHDEDDDSDDDTTDDNSGGDTTDDGSGGGSDGSTGGSTGGNTGSVTRILSLSSTPSGFSGSFGSGDCYRVSVWSKQINNESLRARAWYQMNITAQDEYDYNTVQEFIKYKCSNTSLTFFPEPVYGGGGDWGGVINNELKETTKPTQTVPAITTTDDLKWIKGTILVSMILFGGAMGYLYLRSKGFKVLIK